MSTTIQRLYEELARQASATNSHPLDMLNGLKQILNLSNNTCKQIHQYGYDHRIEYPFYIPKPN